MSQEACNKYTKDLTDDGILITDKLFVDKLPEHFKGKVYELAITHTAKEDLGRALVANIVALGALVKLTGVVSAESLTKAVLARVPKGTEALNEKALALGMGLIK